MKKVYALFGTNIQHSLSPWLHKQFAAQFGLDIDYRLYDVKEVELWDALKRFLDAGGAGANVTAPFKQKILQHVDSVSVAGAINTLTIQKKIVHGDSTDGIGFIRDLQKKGISCSGKQIAILGSGGAAHCIARTMQDQSANVSMIGRNDYLNLARERFDIVVNATSAGLQGAMPPLPSDFVLTDSICYDLNYGQAADPFLKYTRSKGAKESINGIGMLIEQAAEAFYIWHGFYPTTDHIYPKHVL